MSPAHRTNSTVVSWTSRVTGFCESVALGGDHEWGNSISSLFIVFFGLMMVYRQRHTSMLMRAVGAALVVTGVGSTGYHWSLELGWGFIDSLPMLLASYLGLYLTVDAIAFQLMSRRHSHHYEQVSGTMAIFGMTGLVVSLAQIIIERANGHEESFPILFALPELLIGVGIMMIRFYSHKQQLSANNAECVKAKKYMWIGFGVSFGSAVLWVSVEATCSSTSFSRYLFWAHWLWHIGISYGMYLLFQFLIYIHWTQDGNHAVWTTGSIWCTIVPVVDRVQQPLLG
eukprot:TRINITY_DN48357_c0_g1_i1.p1 TRINITY_DN48357_c0_g1~~TRINITY_DN48357_c0_g1_i1.p1  ORF type:complete len:285 (+),score=93.72 TRINITY_DN48357_c0_g1_i1:78-932(+)